MSRPARPSLLIAAVLASLASTPALARQAQRVLNSPIRNHAATIGSLHDNMTARNIGMARQIIHNTPDTAAGVYWNMTNRRNAWLIANYSHSFSPGTMNPVVQQNLENQRLFFFQREQARLARQTAEIKQRQQIRPPLAAAGSTFENPLASVPQPTFPDRTGGPVVMSPGLGFFSGLPGPSLPIQNVYMGGFSGPFFSNGGGPSLGGYSYSPIGGFGYYGQR